MLCFKALNVIFSLLSRNTLFDCAFDTSVYYDLTLCIESVYDNNDLKTNCCNLIHYTCDLA